MTRQERLQFCAVCEKRDFDPRQGIICGLTGAAAEFEGNCKDFVEDPKEVVQVKEQKASLKADTNKSINRGRYALFVIGALYLIVGAYEGFMMAGAELIFGVIDWIAAGVFIGLGIWSYKKASMALILGLSFYVLIILLMFAIEPISLVSGIICKALIIVYLVNAIVTARKEEAKQSEKSEDLLDQL